VSLRADRSGPRPPASPSERVPVLGVTRRKRSNGNTIRQHHKSHRPNNKIPVARVPTQVSFHLRHSHTCRYPALSPIPVSPPCRPLFAVSVRLLSARNSSPFLNSRNRVAVHSRFAERKRARGKDRKMREQEGQRGRCVGHLIEKSDETMGGRCAGGNGRDGGRGDDARDIPCAAWHEKARHVNEYIPPPSPKQKRPVSDDAG